MAGVWLFEKSSFFFWGEKVIKLDVRKEMLEKNSDLKGGFSLSLWFTREFWVV